MCHIEDSQTLVDFLTLYCRAGWEAKFHHDLILLNIVPDHTLLSRNLEQPRDIK